MILDTLEIENVGIYSGLHRFDLAPNPNGHCPVILVKGHNGGGKSTFLESVRLVLYGKRSLGSRIAQSQYEAYLLRKIHVVSPERFARVLLKFSLIEDGKTCNYEIIRSWTARGASVVESFELTREGAMVAGLPSEDWESYVEDLVPPGISQLFFFDGEKIQDIANSTSSEGLRQSIRSLLGLDLIEQLRTDLTLYAARNDRSASDIDLEALQVERDDIEAAIRVAEEERADINSRRDHVLGRVRRAEKVFRDEGGRYATSRETLMEALGENKRKRERLLQALKDAAGDSLPLGLASGLVERLRQTIGEVQRRAGSRAITAFIAAFEAKARASKAGSGLWSNAHFDALRSFVDNESDRAPLPLDADPDFIMGRLDRLTHLRREEVGELAAKLDRNLIDLTAIEEQIEGFDGGLAVEALEELKEAEYGRGRIEVTLKQHDEAIQELRSRRDALEAEWRRSLEAILRRERDDHSRDVAARARAAMVEYEEELLEARVAGLKYHFTDCFNRLIRKSDLVKTIAVDKETFEISLIGADSIEIPRESLSAGERQIFAVSMLWALGKTSGRSLPMVIDTPFSRLDLRHRRAIIEDYVAAASHQVILLCTDTEMTPDLEAMVSPYVSAAYQLEVAEGARSTTSLPLFGRYGLEWADAYQ